MEAVQLKERPDSLQELCVCYCMNNLHILTQLLENVSSDDEDVTSSFSYLLGNKMLDYYTSSCLPSEESQTYINQLVQNSDLCSELCFNRQCMLSPENLEQLAQNKIRKLELTCFPDADDDITNAYRLLVENNIGNLNCVKISQDCEEYVTTGLLNLLSGRDYDSSTEKEEWRGFRQAWLMKAAEGDVEGMADILQKGSKAAASDDSNKVDEKDGSSDMPSNTKYKPFHIEYIGSGAGSSCSNENQAKQIVPNLRSFSYEQLSTSMHPNLEPAHSFGWFYIQLSKILDASRDIHSFSLLSLISAPIDWFLSQPHLTAFQNLQSLMLSMEHIPMYGTVSESLKIPYTETFFENLPALKSLRQLSITYRITDQFDDDVEDERLAYTDKQVEAFIEAIKKMPQIKSLDISGTNLHKIIGHQGYTGCRDHCMPGFQGRQFEFLGLYDTKACEHNFIPALSVSGNASIEQLIAALSTLQINRLLMSKVLHEIIDWFKENQPSVKNRMSLIEVYTAYLARFGRWDTQNNLLFEEDNILCTLQGLLTVLRNEDVSILLTTTQKRLLLDRLMVICHHLTSCDNWRGNNEQKNTIVKISLKLCFVLDDVVTYSYRFQQYVQFLLAVFNSCAKDTQKMLSLNLLHTACRFSQECKAIAGEKMKLVEILLLYILGYYSIGKECNSILQKVWSILWTLTDDVGSNCKLFVENSGCMISKTCIDRYQNEDALLRKISGAMSNVAENGDLREKLMTKELVDMFRHLLMYSDDSDKNDVSSHAAAYLVMLACDGPEAWTLSDPSRDVVLQEVEQAIKTRWKIEVPKGVRFRTLKPILEQIGNYSTPVAQLWGAWVVCNLVMVKPNVYCKMLCEENGIEIINGAVLRTDVRDDVAKLLHSILNRHQTVYQTVQC